MTTRDAICNPEEAGRIRQRDLQRIGAPHDACRLQTCAGIGATCYKGDMSASWGLRSKQ
jgi:hypothetical protein